jgi:hypothetical protein
LACPWRPIPSRLQARRTSFPRPDDRVRVVGAAYNAELIQAIFHLRLRDELQSLEVCTPALLDGVDGRKRPDLLLHAARKLSRSPSLGGWHAFTLKDLPSYALAARLRNQVDDPNGTLALLRGHPAWPALSFIDHLDPYMTASLLATIVDPRWFVDPLTGSSRVRLEQFLGVQSKNATAVRGGDQSSRVQRCRMVASCWNTVEEPDFLESPGSFLWRTWRDRGAGTRGELAASRRFLVFVASVWLAPLCLTGQADRLFVPDCFFETIEEGRAFEAHLAAYRSQSQ